LKHIKYVYHESNEESKGMEEKKVCLESFHSDVVRFNSWYITVVI